MEETLRLTYRPATDYHMSHHCPLHYLNTTQINIPYSLQSLCIYTPYGIFIHPFISGMHHH